MNLRQLETFYWAAELGSFVAASERLRATQSTVSMRIQELERELGVPLFERANRKMRLSAKGRVLLPLAKQIVRVETEIRTAIAAPENISGTLRIGVVEVVSTTWFPRLLKQIHNKYPRVSVEMDEALTQELMERLREGSLDLVLAPGASSESRIKSSYLGELEFAWTASPSLRIPRGPITPKSVVDWPIITLSQQSFHYQSIDRWFQSSGVVLERLYTCKSLAVAVSLAKAGMGVTYLPPRCFRNDLRSKKLRLLEARPAMPRVPFSAFTLVDGTQQLADVAAALAVATSDFSNVR
jgi:DNA-binding transcriptional LysR family regulator